MPPYACVKLKMISEQEHRKLFTIQFTSKNFAR